MSQSRQLAAIMFTDIVGYTALMGSNEQNAFELLKKNLEIQKPIIEEFHGKFIKELGDGVLASFSTVSDALFAAMKIQQACKASNELSLRIGIHEGEIIFENNDIYGDAVNIASRIQTLAIPGAILFSKKVTDEIKNKPEFHTISLGTFEFKNVNESIEVFALANDGFPVPKRSMMEGKLKKNNSQKKNVFWIILPILIVVAAIFIFKNNVWQNDKSEILDKSIAVLPFVDMSPEKDQEYLGDGLAEEIITTLSGIKNLKVIGRTSSFQFKGQKMDLRELGKKLNVGTILEGSVQKFGNKLRITAQLIRVKDHTHLWSQKYDREMADIFKIQDEIAAHITNLLKITLSESESHQLNKTATSPETYTLYLKGLYAYRELKYEQSIDFNTQATKLDPAYAIPYAYIALAKTWIINQNLDFKNAEAFREAESFALQSIKLSPGLAEGYSALALLAWSIELNFSKARDNFEKSVELNPGSSLIKNRYAYFLTWMGDFEKATKFGMDALELDPVDYNSYIILAMVNQYTGQLKKAKEYILEAVRLFPDNNQFQNMRLYNEFLEGNYAFVIRECNSILEKNQLINEAGMAQLGIAYYKTNRMQKSDSVLRQLQTLPIEKNKNGNYYTAVIYAARNQPDSCFAWLKKSIDKPEPAFKLLKIDPAFSLLRNNPAYQKLYNQYGFNKY
ncbi:MAG: adenylate/guanylate cyclase domain-containing protein [Chitinophagaceae bacterium]